MPKMPTISKTRTTTPAKQYEAKAKRVEYDSLDRPLNHYNLFYMLERELFLQKAGVNKSNDTDKKKADSSTVRFEHYADLASSFPPRPARYQGLILPDDWFMHGKKRRTHCRHHGVVTLTEMTSAIALSWKTVDAEVKDFVWTISSMIKQRRDKIRLTRDLGKPPPTHHVMSREVAMLPEGVSCASAGPSKCLQVMPLPISHRRIKNEQSKSGNDSIWDYGLQVDSIVPFHLKMFQSSSFPTITSSTESTHMSRYSRPVVFCQFIQDNTAPNNVEPNPCRNIANADMKRLSAEVVTTSGFFQQQRFQPSGCGQPDNGHLVATPEYKASINKEMPLKLSGESEPVILCQPIHEPVIRVDQASQVLPQQAPMVESWAQHMFWCEGVRPSSSFSQPPLNNQGTFWRNDLCKDVMSNDEIISLYHSLG